MKTTISSGMQKDLREYIEELDKLRGLHVSWIEKYEAIGSNSLGKGIFPEDQLHMVLPDDKQDLKTIFPNIPEIQGRILIRMHALNLSRVENLMELLVAEKDLAKIYILTKPSLAQKVVEEQLKDAVELSLAYNKANDTRLLSNVTIRKQQITADPILDADVLEGRYQTLSEKFMEMHDNASAHPGANQDEIGVLEEIHDIRLRAAENYVSRAKTLLEYAQDLLLQRAQVANAVFDRALPATHSLAKNAGRLLDLSKQYGDMAREDIDNLGLYYQSLSEAGTSPGQDFLVTGFAVPEVLFRF